MKIHLWGTDFRRSPVEMRKKLSIPMEDRKPLLKRLHALGFKDLVYLWTCNRVEFYTTGENYFCDTRSFWVLLLNEMGLQEEDYYRGYHLEGKSALRHILRVACSLESMVVGEPQILGQLKEALAISKKFDIPVDKHLERALHFVFETAKRVRTETTIAEKSVSVASLGLNYLESMELEYPLERAVVVGRSPISRTILQWLKKNKPDCALLWVNRSVEKLHDFPESQGVECVSLDFFLKNTPFFTHLFTATSSLDPIFSREFFESRQVLEGSKKLVFDFAEPSDVERFVLKNIHLVRMEDLNLEARINRLERASSILDAEKIIATAMKEYCLEQKAKPFLRDFGAIEPQFLSELQKMIEQIELEFPFEIQPKVKRVAEILVKRNLHVSREHLREILTKITSADPRSGFFETDENLA